MKPTGPTDESPPVNREGKAIEQRREYTRDSGNELRLAELQVQAPSLSKSNQCYRQSILYGTEWEIGNDSLLPPDP